MDTDYLTQAAERRRPDRAGRPAVREAVACRARDDGCQRAGLFIFAAVWC